MARKGKMPANTEEANVEAKETVNGDTNETPTVEEPKETTAASEESETKKDEVVTNGESTENPKEETKTKKKKPIKKSVPDWATLSDTAKKSMAKTQMSKPRVQDAIIAAISASADSKGVASVGAIKKYVAQDNPDLPKMTLKKCLLKAVEKGLIKQVKGKGFSGSYKLESTKNVAKAKAKEAKANAGSKPPLETVFPTVFTWATNPKESSVRMIQKYISKHYPDLDVEGKAFRKAIDSGESNGQLRRITGKGFSGTFELVDGANKHGGKYEDAIENAIISMNEPKQVSVSALRDYLSCWHNEYNTDNRPLVLKSALERCSAKGWLQQISGKGFSGTYRLMYPYYPSPKELWGADYKEEKKEKKEKTEQEKPSKGKKRPAPEPEEYSDDDDVSDDDEILPTPKKRGAPTPRSSAAVAAKKKKPAAKAPKKPTKAVKSKGKAGGKAKSKKSKK